MNAVLAYEGRIGRQSDRSFLYFEFQFVERIVIRQHHCLVRLWIFFRYSSWSRIPIVTPLDDGCHPSAKSNKALRLGALMSRQLGSSSSHLLEAYRQP